ncbi:MAG TPA: tRNA (adenosine(37)-N6)-threonylcarbamoyltransferase complex ATPase subunit type 1 TsaE [Armatimonadetes bacterium]|nr:tRNA (adenosine(37)-N6)-threonylcarbamoyltransferase complex ATPase subunit type 1 TsaE [Armatimonadota bacterium]
MVNLGRCIAQHLKLGDVLALYGPLGAGKTTLVQGIARGLNVQKPVISPTFIMVREYHGRMPLFHVDAYRLEDVEASGVEEQIGFSDYFARNGIVIIEWADRIHELLPSERLDIALAHEPIVRRVTFTPHGGRYITLMHAICADWEKQEVDFDC